MACDTGVILVTWPDLLPPGPSAYRVRQCGHDEAAIDLRAVARRGRRARRGPGDGGRPRGRACAWDARRRRRRRGQRGDRWRFRPLLWLRASIRSAQQGDSPPPTVPAGGKAASVGRLTRVRWRRGCPYSRAHCEPQPRRRPDCSARHASYCVLRSHLPFQLSNIGININLCGNT